MWKGYSEHPLTEPLPQIVASNGPRPGKGRHGNDPGERGSCWAANLASATSP